MSDANRTKVSFVDEGTFDVVPTSPAWKQVRITGAPFTFTPTNVVSDELITDRQVADLVRVALETGGDLPMEFSYANQDPLLRGAMYSDWVPATLRYNDGTADSVITDVSVGGVYTVITNASNPEKNYGAFAIGQLVRNTGFVAGNTGLFRASAATATSVTLPTTTAEAAPGASARMKVVGIEGASGDITATAGGTNFIGATAANFINQGFVAGMWAKIGGTAAGTKFATAADNDWVHISAVTATQLTLDVVPAGWATDAGAAKTIQIWMGDYIRNGTTARSFAGEVQFQDLATVEYDVYSGLRVGGWTLSANAQQILQSAFSFLGANATNSTTRTAGSTDDAEDILGAIPRVGDVFNASSNVARIAEAGAALAGPNYVQAFSLALSNTLRRQNSIGKLTSHGIGAGRVQVTGKLTTYYGSNAVRTKLLAGTATSLDARFVDPNGTRAVTVDLPRVKLVAGTPQVSGVDTDRILDLDLQALKHATLGYTIQVQRFEEFVA